MIEAVNSVAANAVTLRAVAQQVSASRAAVDIAPTSAPVGEGPSAPQAPYISPYISIDVNYGKAVIQIRDSDTGDVTQQFPTESRMAQLRRVESYVARDQQVEQVYTPAPQQTSETSASVVPEARSGDIITVQDVTSAPPANISPSPQIAAAALSAAGAQSSTSPSPLSSVLA